MYIILKYILARAYSQFYSRMEDINIALMDIKEKFI